MALHKKSTVQTSLPVLFILILADISSLAELRCSSSFLQAVFLTLFHAGVTGQEAFLLEDGAVFRVCLAEGSGDAVTDRAGLAGGAAALDGDVEVELTHGVRSFQRLTDDNL